MDIEIQHAIDAVRTDLRADLRGVDGRLSAEIQQVDRRLSAEIQQVDANLGQKIREEGIATRRHFDVVAESLRDDIRIIAEGLISLDAKVERMRST